MPWTSSDQLVNNLHDVMMETLPSLVKEKVTEQVKKEGFPVKGAAGERVQKTSEYDVREIIWERGHRLRKGATINSRLGAWSSESRVPS
ncbi:hypothetical protein Tco_0071573 [Tanacetum coccineum]